MHLPRQRTADEVALLDVVQRWRRFEWDRFLVAWCAAFHGVIAATLAFAPYEQIYNAGTAPVLDMASRYVWAAVYLAAAGAVALLRLNLRRRVWVALWLAVLLLGGTWLTAFSLAVLDDKGSALGVVVWLFLYGLFAVIGFVGRGKR